MQYHIISDAKIVHGTFKFSFTKEQYDVYELNREQNSTLIYNAIAQNLNKMSDEELQQSITKGIIEKIVGSPNNNAVQSISITFSYSDSLLQQVVITDEAGEQFKFIQGQVSFCPNNAHLLSIDEENPGSFFSLFEGNQREAYLKDTQSNNIIKFYYEISPHFNASHVDQLLEELSEHEEQQAAEIDPHTVAVHTEYDYII